LFSTEIFTPVDRLWESRSGYTYGNRHASTAWPDRYESGRRPQWPNKEQQLETTLIANSVTEDTISSLDVKEPNIYRSRFGGLWTDRRDAAEIINRKLEAGILSEAEAQQLRNWIINGYIIIENAVPLDVIDRVNADTESVWRGEQPSVYVEHFIDGQMHFSPACYDLRMALGKLLDVYSVSKAAREAMFAEPIRNFLKLVFGRGPMAFQSLSFTAGTGQPIHQDTAYVVVSSPMEFAASWIALEDIQPNSGELEYYEGSHEMEEFLFQGQYKSMPVGDPDHLKFLHSLHEKAARMGLERKKFRPKKGDALIWSADLAHGGSSGRDPNTTRLSLVTHYCPVELEPAYYSRTRHSTKLHHADDCHYVHPLR
jgi:phytanoyl-CoA hydroxylase